MPPVEHEYTVGPGGFTLSTPDGVTHHFATGMTIWLDRAVSVAGTALRPTGRVRAGGKMVRTYPNKMRTKYEDKAVG